MLDELETSLSHWRGRKIVVAMSGGVDSALAAAVLRRVGADVVGVHMRVWHYDSCDSGLNAKIATCCSPEDSMDARRVADQFDFPFYSVDYEADFRRAVIDPFIADYLGGRTPNPCVRCNSKLKLGTLLAKARAFGAEAVATGHYGRVRRNPGGRTELLRALDLSKDQTYYLFELRQPQLDSFVMPLGEITKAQTRALAAELNLSVAEKPDSQEICFVTDNDYRRFLREEAGLDASELEGTIVDPEGKVLGRHDGIHNFTVGQRRGLGLSSPAPLYVVELLPETRTVVVGPPEAILSRSLVARDLNWIGRDPEAGEMRARAKIRYRHEPAACTLRWAASGEAAVAFDQPVRAVTPGQAVVFYDYETCQSVIAGGWIVRNGA